MIEEGNDICPNCGNRTKYYDTVTRVVKSEYGRKRLIKLDRRMCLNCGHTHRILPDNLLPYKHYEKSIITGFIQGTIDSCVLEYEDYPSESIINEWKRTQKLRPFL